MNKADELIERLERGESVLKELLGDTALYAECLLQIQTKEGERRHLAYNRCQRILDDKCEELLKKYGKIRLILLKARQFGGSTYIASRIFKMTATMFNQHAKIITQDTDTARRMLGVYQRFYNFLPSQMQPARKYQSKEELVFENPSKDAKVREKAPGLLSSLGIFSAGTAGAGRSSTLRRLHCSEVSEWPDAKSTMLGLLSTVPNTGKAAMGTEIFMESTGKGVGNYFYNRYYSAKRGEPGEEFHALFIPWYMHEEYSSPISSSFYLELSKDERELHEVDHPDWAFENPETGRKTLSLAQIHWRRVAIATLCDHDEQLFKQEYPLTDAEAFIASGQNFFDVEDVQKRLETVQRDVKWVFRGDLEWKRFKGREGRRVQEVKLLENEYTGSLTIWFQPEKGESYVYFADVGEGIVGSDFSVMDIFRRKDGMQVAQWRGVVAPDRFADILFDIGKYYNWAHGSPESNNHGLTTILRLKELGYPNTYKRQVYDKDFVEPQEKDGWQTSARTRPLMLDAGRKAFKDGDVIVNSTVTLEEMKTFVKVRGKFQAQDGCHDDAVMTYCGGCQMLSEMPKPPKSRVKSWMGRREEPGHTGGPMEPKYDKHTGALL